MGRGWQIASLCFLFPDSTGVDDKKYHGIQEDCEAVGDFIRLWTGRYERWASPQLPTSNAPRARSDLSNGVGKG